VTVVKANLDIREGYATGVMSADDFFDIDDDDGAVVILKHTVEKPDKA